MKIRAIVIEIIAFLFIVMLLYTSVSKLSHFDFTVRSMITQPFDDKYAYFMAWAVPSVEIAISVLLLFNRTKLIGFILATSLMAIFTGYVYYVWRLLDGAIPCSCGGAIALLSWEQHLWLNSIYVILGIIAIVLFKRNQRFAIVPSINPIYS